MILIVEDDPAVGRSLRAALEEEGYAVSWAQSVAQGLAAVRQSSPRLIILDVRLPDGSGLDLCRQLRAAQHHQPILMLTARREEMDKVLGLEMGADDYLTKPFGIRELLSRVRALLRRAYGPFNLAGGQQLQVADIRIDLVASQAWRGEEVLSLTPTEYRLLSYLAQHPGQALTRAQLLEGVWGYDAAVESERTVNVHIRRLREKVELDPSQPALILTVPGVGYRLVSGA